MVEIRELLQGIIRVEGEPLTQVIKRQDDELGVAGADLQRKKGLSFHNTVVLTNVPYDLWRETLEMERKSEEKLAKLQEGAYQRRSLILANILRLPFPAKFIKSA